MKVRGKTHDIGSVRLEDGGGVAQGALVLSNGIPIDLLVLLLMQKRILVRGRNCCWMNIVLCKGATLGLIVDFLPKVLRKYSRQMLAKESFRSSCCIRKVGLKCSHEYLIRRDTSCMERLSS